MKFDPLLVAPLLLFLNLGTTLKCYTNHTATRYRFCLEVGERGLLEGRIVTCLKNEPCDDPEFYPCGNGGTTDVHFSTEDDVFTLNTTIAEKTQAVNATETSRATTTRTFPHAAHGFNFVLNSSATKNGSVFFFSEDVVTTARVTTVESYSSKTPENVTPDPNFDSSAWAAMGNTEKNDVAKNSEPHKTTENVTTVEDRNMDTLSASEITTTPKSTETKLHGNPINMANVADEDGDSKILSTVLEDSTTTLRTIETKPSTSTESDIIDPFTEERNFETSSIVESTTTSTIIPRIQTTIIANTQNTSKHNQLISGANIIISALTTILGIILGFILIDFIFW